MMREDWIEVKLGEICDLKNGFAFKSKDYVEISETMNFRMSQIRPNGKIDLDHNPKYLPDEYASSYSDYLLENGDIVIAMTDMASDTKILGVPTIVKQDKRKLLLNQRVGKLFNLNTNCVYIPYLRYIITSPQIYSYYKKLGKGGVQINLSKDDILNAKLPLAPLPEQRAIASKIEQLFSELDNGIANLKTAKSKLEIYRQAILKQAFEGKLTNPKNKLEDDLPSGGTLKRINSLCEVVRGGSPRPAGDLRYYEGNIPFLKVADITRNEGTYLNTHTFTIKEAGLKNTRYVEANTLLLSNSGATLGVPKICTLDLLQNQKHVRFISFLSELKLSDEIRSQSKSISDRI